MKQEKKCGWHWKLIVLYNLIGCIGAGAQPMDASNTAYLIRLNDTLYMDIAEVSITRWHEFADLTGAEHRPLDSVIRQKEYYYLFQPHPSGKVKSMQLEGEFTKIKLDLHADSMETAAQKTKARWLLQYPVVGITYEQAKAFCEWRTVVYNEKHYGITDSTQFKIRFDLPAPWMYELVLTSLDSFKRCATFNYRSRKCKDEKLNKQPDYSAIGKDIIRVNALKQDDHNLYNTRGNVAEMTNRKGVAKGGSYHHFARAAHPKALQYYKKPEPWLGFRCITVVMRPLPPPKYKTIFE